MTPTTTPTKEAVLALLDRKAEKQMAQELVEKILHQGTCFRNMLEDEQVQAAVEATKQRDDLLRERSRIYKKMVNTQDRDSFLKQVRSIAGSLQSLNEQSFPKAQDAKALLEAIHGNLSMLQELVGHDKELPWRLRFVENVNPESDEPIMLGGGAILNTRGQFVWADYCNTCGIELEFSEARYRCMSCVKNNVQCMECRKYFPDIHGACDPGVVLEHSHPTFSRLDASCVACKSLAATLVQIFAAWAHRPCFRAHDMDCWFLYQDVVDRALRIASQLTAERATKVLLCFPAGSMEFYLCDLGAALAGITTIGLPVSPAPPTLPECSHVICDDTVKEGIHFPSECNFVDIDKSKDFEPFEVSMNAVDPPESLYTIYYTSGTTGKPKEIPVTRKDFLKDFSLSAGIIPGCVLSYLPPCWATDRGFVYQHLYNGGRIGFSRKEPTLSQIVEDLTSLGPTAIIAPPLVLQFLSKLNPPASLGTRLQHITGGGAPVGPVTKRIVSETYGVPVFESYGTTECGGIACDGSIFSSVVDSIRLKDINTGEWRNTKEEGVTGQLWIGDHNTNDLVELTKGGTCVQVLGRSGSSCVSFKLSNGKWCCLIDIEDEIARKCSPDLLIEGCVLQSKTGNLVLVAVRDFDNGMDEVEMLAEICNRVSLGPEAMPTSILFTREPFPKTATMKIKRSDITSKYQEKVDESVPLDVKEPIGLDVAEIAARVLGRLVDPSLSFFENGGDSLLAVQWLDQMKAHFESNELVDWRFLLNNPLCEVSLEPQDIGIQNFEGDIPTIDPAPTPPALSKHVLLTGATGFLGGFVLKELLDRDNNTIVVCLVRESSKHKLEASDRVMVATEVPRDLQYRHVFHLAANVNHVLDYAALKTTNVDLTEHLLRLRLAPLTFSSTYSTREGNPPFSDGYTQTKWVSEQMVLRSCGTCIWPPLLLWGNSRDWITRLLQHCLRNGVYPVEVGFLAAAPVQVTAKEVIEGGPCSVWDLDLSELFLLIRRTRGIQPVSLPCFLAGIKSDPESPAYPILPLLQGRSQIGNGRTPHLDLLQIDEQEVCCMMKNL